MELLRRALQAIKDIEKHLPRKWAEEFSQDIAHLSMADDSDDFAVFLHLLEVLLKADLSTIILPTLGGLGERLLLRAVPLVEREGGKERGKNGKGEGGRGMSETHQYTRHERSFRTATKCRKVRHN